MYNFFFFTSLTSSGSLSISVDHCFTFDSLVGILSIDFKSCKVVSFFDIRLKAFGPKWSFQGTCFVQKSKFSRNNDHLPSLPRQSLLPLIH